MELTELTVSQAHEGLKQKEFSSRELTRAYLDRISANDSVIDAYLSVAESEALLAADDADRMISQGEIFSPLCGVPASIKDSILVKGQLATDASKILENYTAPYDATVIERLKKEGAIILGKTNTDEFTMGVSTENSAFKVTKNPHDHERVPGGSSGGPAASVAANEAAYALGSDTGGSIRLPASFCGVVGLNPTYGSVSRYGAIALASSLDQIGPIAKTVEDAALVFKAICGRDPKDATSADYRFLPQNVSLKGLRIGIPKEYFGKGIDPQVERIIRSAIEKAEGEGAKIIEVSLPSTEYAIACYYIIVPCEASSNLARYDGIRYGLSVQDAGGLLDVYLKSRGAGFGPEPKRRILMGTYALSAGYYDAYYKKAQAVRQLVRDDFSRVFEHADVLFSPVSPIPAFKIGEKADDPLSMYLMDIYTCPVKLAGVPALSLPAGKAGNLPVGLQIIGNHFEENKILAVASAMEKLLQ
jgi:aspartyl-tRNA(Asn)/glutamyl-tRNA(Gln) amidotransferase subunit A